MASPITGVPKDSVGEVVQSFIDNDNATHVEVVQRADGTFIVAPDGASFHSTAMAPKAGHPKPPSKKDKG